MLARVDRLFRKPAALGLALAAAVTVTLVAPATAGAATPRVPSASAPHAGSAVPPAGQVQARLLTPQHPGKSEGKHSPPFRTMNPAALQAAKLKAAGPSQRASGTPSVAAKPLAGGLFNGLNSPGLSAADGGNTATPPDSTGAIGPTRYVEMVNNLVGVFDRSNLARLSQLDLGTFTAVPAGLTTSDPQIQWDPQANRWFYGAVAFANTPGNNNLLFGWSKTADPSDLAGGWCRYGSFNGSMLQDYPKLGHDANFLTFGSNVYDDSKPKFPFVTANIWAIHKPAAGDSTCSSSVSATFFADATHLLKNSDGTLAFTPVPANTADAAANGYIVAAHDPSSGAGPQAKVMVWHMETRPTTPFVALVADGDVSVGSSYSVPPNVPQPGTSFVLDSLDGRLTQAVAHFDPSVGAEAVWTQHTVAGPGRSIVRWYEFLPSTLAIRQQGQLASATDFYWNAAVSPSSGGSDAAIFYNRGSSSLLPVIGAQTRVSSTPLGQMDTGEVLLGSSIDPVQETAFGPNCTSIPCRWGDYSGATPDPVNAGVVWGSNQLSGQAFPLGLGFAQWTTQNFAVGTTPWIATYNVGGTPTSWNSGQTQTYSVTVTNSGSQTWPAGSGNPVHLGVHFTNGGSTWYTDQRYSLPADLASGASVTLNIAVTAPANSGSLVLEYRMVKELQFWFNQFAVVNVTVVPSWVATYNVGGTPTSWSSNQTQTYNVTISNTGSQTWPAGGSNPVRLGVHFANPGGAGNIWYTDQRFSLLADLAPGATSMPLSIAVTAPANSGNLVIEYQMVKELQFWFSQVADVNVTVVASWAATYSVGGTPTNWSSGQTRSYTVTITNAGSQTWPAGGSNPVRLGVHFANTGGAGNIWYTDQRFSLLADLAPGATSMPLSIAVTAPANSGSLVLEYRMVKELQFWFSQFAVVNVTVVPSWVATYNVGGTPTSWSSNQTQTYNVTISNTGSQTWPAGGSNPVRLGVHFTNGVGTWYTDQRYNLPADLAPGTSLLLNITVTPPANRGSLVLEYQMVKELQFWFSQVAAVNVTVS